jgi:pantoate kinase
MSRRPSLGNLNRDRPMENARAFAPGNISCIFRIVPNEDPARMHSLGMGFTVRDGVVVSVSLDRRPTVLFNGSEIRFPTVASVVEKLTSQPLRVDLESQLPLSCGFGLSGASALAAAYAVNALLGLGKPEVELAMTAHVAEVEHLTGLGDVCGQYHGGCRVRLKPGHPLAAEPLAVGEQPIYYRHFGPIHTRDVLADPARRDRINRAADAALEKLEELVKLGTVDFNACIRVSKVFAVDSGLLSDPRVRRVIQEIEADNGCASMIMLGHAVFSTQFFKGAQKTMLGRYKVSML